MSSSSEPEKPSRKKHDRFMHVVYGFGYRDWLKSQETKYFGRTRTFDWYVSSTQRRALALENNRNLNPLLVNETLGWRIMADAEDYERQAGVMEANPFIDRIASDPAHAFAFMHYDKDED
jgi:hypothetical protein